MIRMGKSTRNMHMFQTWADRVLGSAHVVLTIAVLFSTFGAANGTVFSGGR